MLNFLSKEEVWSCLDDGLHTQLGWQTANVHLKTWQDVVVYNSIRDSSGKRIAEIGGGSSRILQQLSKNNECTNVDRFAGQDGGPLVERKIAGVQNVLAFVGDYRTDLKSNYFNAVISVSVLEHVPIEAGKGFIDDHVRIMKPGGLALHAIDMYLGDSETDFNRKRLEMYTGWLRHPDVEPMGPIMNSPAVLELGYVPILT